MTIEYICGTLAESSPSKIVIDIGGLGYGVFIGASTFEKLPQTGQKMTIYTAEIIREDSHRLFGFLTPTERNFFLKLNDISGIGPKSALSLLGHLPFDELLIALQQSNVKLLGTIPGIGKKTAERLIIELRDKVDHASPVTIGGSTITNDAISALMNLGFNPLEAQRAVKTVLTSSKEEPPLSQLISLALKNRGK